MNQISLFVVICILVVISFMIALNSTMMNLNHEHLAVPDEVQSDLASFHMKNQMHIATDKIKDVINEYDSSETELIINKLIPPNREERTVTINTPPTIEEVKSNLTWFFRTLEDRFKEIAGPKVTY